MEKSLMTIQELETQLLSLNPTERLRIAQLLTQSVSANGAPNETWKSIDTLSIDNSTEAWSSAIRQLQSPTAPQVLANLLQSWEDEGDAEDQKETWEFLHQVLDQDRLSDRPLFS
jgi:hypothetical protein